VPWEPLVPASCISENADEKTTTGFLFWFCNVSAEVQGYQDVWTAPARYSGVQVLGIDVQQGPLEVRNDSTGERSPSTNNATLAFRIFLRSNETSQFTNGPEIGLPYRELLDVLLNHGVCTDPVSEWKHNAMQQALICFDVQKV